MNATNIWSAYSLARWPIVLSPIRGGCADGISAKQRLKQEPPSRIIIEFHETCLSGRPSMCQRPVLYPGVRITSAASSADIPQMITGQPTRWRSVRVRGRGCRRQHIEQLQNVPKHFPRNHDFGHLERRVAAVARHRGSDLGGYMRRFVIDAAPSSRGSLAFASKCRDRKRQTDQVGRDGAP